MKIEEISTQAAATNVCCRQYSVNAKSIADTAVLLLALIATISFSGCVTESEEPSHIRVGMSREDLRFFFGDPLRIEPVENGGEVWFYRVITPYTPQVEGAAWEGPIPGDGGVALGVSPTPKMRIEAPIFLSPEGRVVDPVPIATIRGR